MTELDLQSDKCNSLYRRNTNAITSGTGNCYHYRFQTHFLYVEPNRASHCFAVVVIGWPASGFQNSSNSVIRGTRPGGGPSESSFPCLPFKSQEHDLDRRRKSNLTGILSGSHGTPASVRLEGLGHGGTFVAILPLRKIDSVTTFYSTEGSFFCV